MPRRADKYTADGKPRHKKINTRENGYVDLVGLKKREKGKLPLRINKSLVLLVTPDKCNEAYAETIRARMNIN